MNTQQSFLKGAVHSVKHGIHAGTHLSEGLHEAILGTVSRYNPFMRRDAEPGGVYRLIRNVVSLAALGGVRTMEWALTLSAKNDFAERPLKPWQLHWVTGFNAAWGDFFAEEGHPWAVPMGFARGDEPGTFTTGFPGWLDERPSPHLMVFIHGLGMNELAWRDANGRGYARSLAQEAGAEALMLRYNTGLPIHDNGELLAQKLEQLVREYPVPVESLTLVGHSMGGLVSLSAGHYGLQSRHRWTGLLRGVACIGSPHRGAHLEVGGNWVTYLLSQSTYAAPLSLIGKRRSAGIKDLRHGSLRPEDWIERDRDDVERFHPHPVAMVPGARYLMVASTVARAANVAVDKAVGDGLVIPDSALKPRFDEADENRVLRERLDGINHLGLLVHPRVGEVLTTWYRQLS